MLPEFATNVTVASFFKQPNIAVPLTTVTELELPAKLSRNLMIKAGFLFPNVIELALGYQAIDSLQQIWTMWPKLKSLHLSVLYNDKRNAMEPKIKFLKLDELLTGFDKSQLDMAKNGNGDVIGEAKFPSITKLKGNLQVHGMGIDIKNSFFFVFEFVDLRELTINGAPYRTHSKKSVLDEKHWNKAKEYAISDISVHHALMMLPSLKYLDISQHFYNVIGVYVSSMICLICNLFSRFRHRQIWNYATT